VLPDLSVVLPAYNEELRLPRSLEVVLAFLEDRGRPFEVLVVDDGSRDRTRELAASFGGRGVRVLGLPRNRGKGAALREGVLASRGGRVLLTDADLSTPIEDLARLEPHLEHAAIVVGSRAHPDSAIERHQPFYRETMGKVFNRLLRHLGLTELPDTQCGFKLLRGEVARQLFAQLTIDGFAYDVELLWRAKALGHEVAAVGVRWADSPSSRVHPLFDSARMLWDVVRLRWRLK
jgi:dolichyl-phosphate beta-glucosyltransferase